MSLQNETIHIVKRFGLGARPDELRDIGTNGQDYVLAQLEMPARALLDDTALRPSHEVLSEQMHLQFERRMAKRMARRGAGITANNSVNSRSTFQRVKKKLRRLRRETFRDEALARLMQGYNSDTPFLERLVLFWSNHFTVSTAKLQVRSIVGAYEREVIRPHVLGRFEDMLQAAIHHPAMLIYLDNKGSIGPNSRAGRRRGKGLNENLAREVLELHTVGVDGGYSQEDVTNFARILTGWTIANPRRHGDQAGKFFFARRRHEPGAWTVLGKRYEDEGAETGWRVLSELARHPATARHIARKLAIHFVSDKPPQELVRRLERSFLDSGGDLKELARTLVTASEAWAAPAKKIIPPYDMAVSLMRGLDIHLPLGQANKLLKSLGQPLWRAPSPKGWPDGDLAWASPSAIRERLRVAGRMAQLAERTNMDPRELAETLFGLGLSSETQLAVARAETRRQGFELLIMSPEFQRR